MDFIRLATTVVTAVAAAYVGANVAAGAVAGLAEPQIRASQARKNGIQENQSPENVRELADIPEYDEVVRECNVYFYARPLDILEGLVTKSISHWALMFIFEDGSVRVLEAMQDENGIMKPTITKENPLKQKYDISLKQDSQERKSDTNTTNCLIGKIYTSPYKLRIYALENPLSNKKYCTITRNCQGWVKELANLIGGVIKDKVNKIETFLECNPLFALSYYLANKASSFSSHCQDKLVNQSTHLSKFSYQDKGFDSEDSLAKSDDRSAYLPEYDTKVRQCEVYLYTKSLEDLAKANYKTVCHWALLFIFEDGVIRLLQGLRDDMGMLKAYISKGRPMKIAGSRCYQIGIIQNSPQKLQLLAQDNMLNNSMYDNINVNCQEWIKELARYLDSKIESKIEDFFSLFKSDTSFAVSMCFTNDSASVSALSHDKRSAETPEYDKFTRKCEVYLSYMKLLSENQKYIYNWSLLFLFEDGTARLLEGITNKNGKLQPYILKDKPSMTEGSACYHVGSIHTSPFSLRLLALKNPLNNQKLTTSIDWVKELGKCLEKHIEQEIDKVLTQFIPKIQFLSISEPSCVRRNHKKKGTKKCHKQ